MPFQVLSWRVALIKFKCNAAAAPKSNMVVKWKWWWKRIYHNSSKQRSNDFNYLPSCPCRFVSELHDSFSIKSQRFYLLAFTISFKWRLIIIILFLELAFLQVRSAVSKMEKKIKQKHDNVYHQEVTIKKWELSSHPSSNHYHKINIIIKLL